MKNALRNTFIVMSAAASLALISPKAEAKLGSDFQEYKTQVEQTCSQNLPMTIKEANSRLETLAKLEDSSKIFYSQTETEVEVGDINAAYLHVPNHRKAIVDKFEGMGNHYDKDCNKIRRFPIPGWLMAGCVLWFGIVSLLVYSHFQEKRKKAGKEKLAQ